MHLCTVDNISKAISSVKRDSLQDKVLEASKTTILGNKNEFTLDKVLKELSCE